MEINKPKIEIVIPKISRFKNDSFWYFRDIPSMNYNDRIANVYFENKHYVIVTNGEIRVKFTKNGNWFINQNAVDEAFERGLGDKRFREIYKIDMGNWFEVEGVNKNGFYELDFGINGCVAMNYDESIELAIDLIQS